MTRPEITERIAHVISRLDHERPYTAREIALMVAAQSDPDFMVIQQTLLAMMENEPPDAIFQ